MNRDLLHEPETEPENPEETEAQLADADGVAR
jgi:hypothetical protein